LLICNAMEQRRSRRGRGLLQKISLQQRWSLHWNIMTAILVEAQEGQKLIRRGSKMDQIPFPAQSVQVTIGCFPRHPNHNVNSGLARTSLMTGNQCTCMIRIVVDSTGEGNNGLLSKLAPSSPDYSSRNAEDPAASCIAARGTIM